MFPGLPLKVRIAPGCEVQETISRGLPGSIGANLEASLNWAMTRLMMVSFKVVARWISTEPLAVILAFWAILKKETTSTVIRVIIAKTVRMATPCFFLCRETARVADKRCIGFFMVVCFFGGWENRGQRAEGGGQRGARRKVLGSLFLVPCSLFFVLCFWFLGTG